MTNYLICHIWQDEIKKGAATWLKNFGKILLGLTAAGAAGAGAYYWLKNRHNEEPEDEFDDTFEEDDFELDDDLGEVPERGYTTLTPTSAKKKLLKSL